METSRNGKMRENSIISTAGQLSDICRHHSRNSSPVAPQVWFWFYHQTCFLVEAGKQYWGLFLLGSRHSRGAPAVLSPGGSRAGSDSLTPKPASPKLPLLIHGTQKLGWLDNVDLYHCEKHSLLSLWQLRYSVLLFPQRTPGWGVWD